MINLVLSFLFPQIHSLVENLSTRLWILLIVFTQPCGKLPDNAKIFFGFLISMRRNLLD